MAFRMQVSKYARSTSPASHLTTEFVWHTGTEKPKFYCKVGESIVQLLQADGDELEIIIKHFVNVPHCHNITTWRDSMAQFIYDNL